MGLDKFVSDDNNEVYYKKESLVVRELRKHLENDGFNIQTQNTGIDVIAKSEHRTLGIEVKRHYEADPGQKVYTALGQIIYRMDMDDIESDSINGAIGFPRDINGDEIYRQHIEQNLSREILELLSVCVVLVDRDGYEIIEPGDIGKTEQTG